MRLRVLTTALLLACPAFAEGPADRWTGALWADPSQPYTATHAAADGSGLRCLYRYDEGAFAEAKAETAEQGVRITAPPPEGAAERLTLRIESQGAVAAERTVPVAKRFEFDVTGDAAIPIPYPLIDRYAEAVFVPCCAIYGGILEAYTLSDNPAGVTEGLPGRVDGRFVILAPDELVVSTSGLNMVFRPGQPPAPGLEPAIYSFNPRTQAWAAITNPKVDAEKGTISADSPTGGTYALGWVAE